MGNCIFQCFSGEKDQYHRSSPEPSGRLSYAYARDGTINATSFSLSSAEVETTLSTAAATQEPSGPCSPPQLNSAEVSDGPIPSGPISVTSAEVDTTLSTAAATQEPSGPFSPPQLTSAEVSDGPIPSGPISVTSAEVDTTLSMAAATQEPSGPCSPPQLTSAEVSDGPIPSGPISATSAEVDTTLSMAAATQEPSGPCSPPQLTSAEVSDGPIPSGPISVTSAEVDTTLSMAAATQEPSGPCSPPQLTSAEVSDGPIPSGPISATSAEVDTTLSMAAATQEPSGPCSPPQLTSAEVSDGPIPSGPISATSAEVDTTLSMAAATQEPSGPCSPPQLTSAEVSDGPIPSGPISLSSAEVEATLSTAAATQESSGTCSPPQPETSGPSCLFSTEANTSLSMAAATQKPSMPSISAEVNASAQFNDDVSAASTTSSDITGHDANTPTSDTTINLSTFTLHLVLGSGGFGKVVLATHRKTQQKVAIKSVVKYRHEHEIETERDVLELAAGCPFLTHLYASFQTRFSACFVMEYISGGTLRDFLEDYFPVDCESIKFIVAETAFGLEFLHKRGILHRDIKPANILMHGNGHIRVADYGLAVVNLYDDQITTGSFGTVGYMAPEVVNNDFYKFEPDWFSLGVTTYILATGHKPFKCSTEDEYRREVNHCHPVYPPDMDPHLEDFIEGLLCKYPDERLGIQDDISCHPFLDTIDWDDLEEGKIPPPFPVEPPVDMDIPMRLSPAVLHQHPKTSKQLEHEVDIPDLTYVCSSWARM